MSTATAIDAKTYLTGWLQALTGMTIADINAIPDDKWCASIGGCARPASALLADAVVNLRWTADILGGANESDVYDHMVTTAEEAADKNSAITLLKEAADGFIAAFKAASDERLSEVITAPWGAPVPVYMLAQISVSHVWYHDGQFNYIQCLLGDGEVHWKV